jgi:hypothetical protein
VSSGSSPGVLVQAAKMRPKAVVSATFSTLPIPPFVSQGSGAPPGGIGARIRSECAAATCTGNKTRPRIASANLTADIPTVSDSAGDPIARSPCSGRPHARRAQRSVGRARSSNLRSRP